MKIPDFSFLEDPDRVKEQDVVIALLSKIFIKDRDKLSVAELRGKYGVLCGVFGIFLNLLLFAGKLIAGLLSGAISIVADAFNNLSDAGSSLITLLGFRLAAQKPDSDHPFGHGRIEYISGLLVSILIILVGFELGKSSIEKIISPEPIVFSVTSILILVVSVLVKLYMALYNHRIGKKIASPAMHATSIDSFSDALATTVVLICMLISRQIDIQIDAWCGLAVSAFILFSGFRAAGETVSPLLGQPPSDELVKQIEDIVRSHPYVCGIHDLVVHDYGPGRLMISLHAEVPANIDILKVHDSIDNAEKQLRGKLQCDAVIHMDPIETDDALTSDVREKILALVKQIDESVTIHDFRMVSGETHTNVIFDVVIPFAVDISDKEAIFRICKMVRSLDERYFAVINIDRSCVK